MKEHGLLLKAPLVLATLNDAKTMTRRVLTKNNLRAFSQPWSRFDFDLDRAQVEDFEGPACDRVLRAPIRAKGTEDWKCLSAPLMPKWRVGDLLWAKEAWLPDPPRDGTWMDLDEWTLDDIPERFRKADHVLFRADGKWDEMGIAWRSSMFMPRWASRLTLCVTRVTCERVADITDHEAVREGIQAFSKDGGRTIKYGIPDREGTPGAELGGWAWQDFQPTPRDAFRRLWNLINDKPKAITDTTGKIAHYLTYPFDGEPHVAEHRGLPLFVRPNPWVATISYERIRGEA